MERIKSKTYERIARSITKMGLFVLLLGGTAGCAGKVVYLGEKEAIIYKSAYEQCHEVNGEMRGQIKDLIFELEVAERQIDALEGEIR